MATIKRFEDLEIWQLARELNKKLIPHLDHLNEKKNFDLKSQLDGAAGSVMDNIAEGFERDGNKEFIQHLAISKGSLGEVRSQLYRVLDRNFITETEFEIFKNECFLLSGKIAAFITYLRNSDFRGNKFKDKS